MKNTPDQITQTEAAELLGISKSTLRVWEKTRKLPLPRRIEGEGLIYSRSALMTWQRDQQLAAVSAH